MWSLPSILSRSWARAHSLPVGHTQRVAERLDPAVAWARITRAAPRLFTVTMALAIAVTTWSGVWGWLVGLLAVVAGTVFEFHRWWEYVLHGQRRPIPRLAGSHRFRQPGSTRVVLVDAGPRPAEVSRCLARVTKCDKTTARRILDETPTIAVMDVSLTSAEHVVTALLAAGADARLQIQEISSGPDEA